MEQFNHDKKWNKIRTKFTWDVELCVCFLFRCCVCVDAKFLQEIATLSFIFFEMWKFVKTSLYLNKILLSKKYFCSKEAYSIQHSNHAWNLALLEDSKNSKGAVVFKLDLSKAYGQLKAYHIAKTITYLLKYMIVLRSYICF